MFPAEHMNYDFVMHTQVQCVFLFFLFFNSTWPHISHIRKFRAHMTHVRSNRRYKSAGWSRDHAFIFYHKYFKYWWEILL